MIIAANAPDLDLLGSGFNNIRYLAWHRGVTHSLLAWPVWAVLIALAVRWVAKRQKQTVPGWGIAIALGLVGVGSHLLLDWTNAYGIRLFAPVWPVWYAANLEPIIDPWIWAVLLACLGVPMLLNLVSREVGSRGSAHRASAVVALTFLVGWCGVRWFVQQRAEEVLNQPLALYQGQAPQLTGVLPSTVSPLTWYGIADFPDHYLLTYVDAASGHIDYTEPQQIYMKPQWTPALKRAEQTPAGQTFLAFARYPLAEIFQGEHGTRVFLTDLRFVHAGLPPRMGLTVRLSPALQVEQTHFSWLRGGGPVQAAPETGGQ
jgi:inner membrane protein